MIPNSRSTFQLYCLRKLGFPAVEVNLDQDQIDDRIDEALLYYRNHHDDAVQQIYLKHKVSAEDIDRQYIDLSQGSGTVSTVAGSNTVQGLQTSFFTDFAPGVTTIQVGSEAYPLVNIANSTLMTVAGPFINSSNNVPYYIPEAATSIVSISDIFRISSTSAQVNMFDLRYQLRLHELYDFTSTSYVNYVITQQHLRTLDLLFSGDNPFRYNRHMNKLYIDWKWGDTIQNGEYVVMKAQKALDPNLYTEIWNDEFLKEYTTALLKRQWATNMKKYDKVVLPGGLSINAADMYNEAIADIKSLEESVQSKWSMLTPFEIG